MCVHRFSACFETVSITKDSSQKTSQKYCQTELSLDRQTDVFGEVENVSMLLNMPLHASCLVTEMCLQIRAHFKNRKKLSAKGLSKQAFRQFRLGYRLPPCHLRLANWQLGLNEPSTPRKLCAGSPHHTTWSLV